MKSGELARMAIVALLSATSVPAANRGEEKTGVARRDLSGRWVLNPGKSDDPQAKLRETLEGARNAAADDPPMEGEPTDGRRGRGLGGGSGAAEGRRSPSPEMADAARRAMNEVMQPARRLTITQGDLEVTIATDDGRTLRLFTDGRKNKQGRVERRTKWDYARLMSRAKVEGGPAFTESWELSADGKELHATIWLPLPIGDREVVINRVYEAAPAD